MRFTVSLLAAVLMVCATASAAPAPPGSYRQSCQDIYADGDVLAATCRNNYGNRNYTTLSNYRDCDGDIANRNGRLVCVYEDDDNDDDDWTPRGSRSCRGDIANVNGWLRCRRDDDDNDDDDYDLPGGSWRSSCRNARIYGSMLHAQCRDYVGAWRDTSLDLRNCEGDVRNNNGRLSCGYGGFGRITLYKHANFGGKSRSYSSDVPDLNPFAFGNQASSVVVQGGVWQLCDRPNYRGYCVIIDRTQPNLWVFGFNDRTESVRRIR